MAPPTTLPRKQSQSAWGAHDTKEWAGPFRDQVISVGETLATTLVHVIHGPPTIIEDDL